MPSGVYKRKGRKRIEEIDGGASIEPTKEGKISPELEAVIRSLPGDEKVELYRESLDDSGKWAFLSSVQAGIFSTDWVQKNCGGGNYMVLVRKPGSHELLARKFFEIDPSIGRRAPFQPTDDKAALGLGDGGLPPMMGLILQMQQASSDRMIEMMQSSSQQMTTLLAAVLGKGNDISGIVSAVAQLNPRTDPIETYARLSELTKGRDREPTTLADKLEEFQIFKRLFSGAPDDETGGWASLVRDFLPGTLTVLQEALKRRDAAPAAPPVQGALPPGTPDQLTLFLPAPLAHQIRSLVPQLVKRGLAGGDAEAFAVTVMEDAPVGLYPQIHKALAEDGAIDAILAAAPELAQVEAYAREFLGVILDMTAEPEEEAVESEVAPAPVKGKKKAKATP